MLERFPPHVGYVVESRGLGVVGRFAKGEWRRAALQRGCRAILESRVRMGGVEISGGGKQGRVVLSQVGEVDVTCKVHRGAAMQGMNRASRNWASGTPAAICTIRASFSRKIVAKNIFQNSRIFFTVSFFIFPENSYFQTKNRSLLQF